MEFDGFYISIGDQCSFVLEKHGFILLAYIYAMRMRFS